MGGQPSKRVRAGKSTQPRAGVPDKQHLLHFQAAHRGQARQGLRPGRRLCSRGLVHGAALGPQPTFSELFPSSAVLMPPWLLQDSGMVWGR